jgi:hypothetical protein
MQQNHPRYKVQAAFYTSVCSIYCSPREYIPPTPTPTKQCPYSKTEPLCIALCARFLLYKLCAERSQICCISPEGKLLSTVPDEVFHPCENLPTFENSRANYPTTEMDASLLSLTTTLPQLKMLPCTCA